MKGDPSSTTTTLGALGLVLVLLAGFALLPRVFTPRVREAPDFSLEVVANAASLGPGRAEGKTLSLSELRGSPVLLDFWATWCGPCRAEAPIIDQVSRRWHDRGVVVVGVSVDKDEGVDPGADALRHGLSYAIVHDRTGQAQHDFGVDSLPTLVVVSRTGKITAVRTGMTDDAEIERLLRQAM
jgi:thiol-disulfide isomerase/thioredoxin